MCCHQHPDNGHGLEKTDASPVAPWTLEELWKLFEEWHEKEDCEDCHAVDSFFRWLGEQ